MTRWRILLAVLWLLPSGAGAQTVVGTVSDQATRQPITGAMVRLMDGPRWTGVLFLTAADGRFRLQAPGPGAYTLRVERIGFGETTVGPVTLEVGATVPFDIAIGTAPIRLEGFDVSAGRRRCSLQSDVAGATQTLWDEVRKALDAALWTEQEAGLQFQVVQRTRKLDAGGLGVQDESRRVTTLFGGNSVRTLPPRELAEDGYVREEGGFIYYFGPDASVLLSDPFLDTHCFTLVEGPEAEPHLVGLEFQPVRTRAPDITGVLWADRETARLERVEFAYTGLGRRPGAEQARGEVRFAELSDGRWIVRDWFIRAPLLGLTKQFVAGVLRERVMVTGVQEQGSEVISATGRDVTWRADIPWGTVEGVVWDSVSGQVLAGAEVALGGRSRLTRTDEAGRFRIEDVAPGTYWMSFDHPVLDTLGVYPAWKQVTIEADSVVPVTLGVPALMTVLALQCQGGPAVVGLVTDGLRGEPVPGASVSGVGVTGPGLGPAAGRSTPEGRYWLCGLEGGATARLVARMGPLNSSPVDVTVPEEGYVVKDLVLPLSSAGAAAEAAVGDGQAALVGTVVDMATGGVVDGALVQLLAADGAVVEEALSDQRGRVLLFPDEPGSYRLRAERLGFADSEGATVDLFQGTRRVEIRMATEAIPLEEMVVTVRGTVPALERNGFYQRESMADGRFMIREDIEAVGSSRTSDVLIRVPGIGPVTFNEEAAESTKRRIQFSRARSAVDARCLPVVYIDGIMVRQGGIWSPLDDPSRWPTEEQLIGPHDLEALELYPSRTSVPARFQGPGAECGVVVVWTRQGIGR